MKLWYISIGLTSDLGYDTEYRYQFKLHTRFISNYFSKILRKKKNWLEADGNFSMISVDLKPNGLEDCKVVPVAALSVPIAFNQAKYEKIKGSSDCEYYLELLEEGLLKASKCKDIRIDNLLKLIEEFRLNDYKNEWLHKKKKFREQDIEISLNCCFTTLDFKLIATIKKISTKEELCSGIVLETDADEICYDKEFKDIYFTNKEIIITDWFDKPRFSINLMNALNRKFSCESLKKIY